METPSENGPIGLAKLKFWPSITCYLLPLFAAAFAVRQWWAGDPRF